VTLTGRADLCGEPGRMVGVVTGFVPVAAGCEGGGEVDAECGFGADE
jgi:hypothetical protein